MVAAEATLDPEHAAKSVQAKIFACSSPPGTPVITLGDIDHVWLRAYVNETDLGRVTWGQAVDVTTDTFPGKRYHGTIGFISSEAEFTPKSVQTQKERVTLVYRIKVNLDNPNRELKPGMPADGVIHVQPAGAPR